MEMQIRQRTGDPDDMRPEPGNVIVELSKATGKRYLELPRAVLARMSP